MQCVYLWNKRWAVCQDWNPADGSCSFTVIQAAEKLTRCFGSLCGNVCVQRNKSWEECSASVSVSFQPVGQDISCTKRIRTPLRPRMGWNLWSLPRGSRQVPQMRPWRWRSDGLYIEQKESNLFCYKAGWSPKAVKTLQQLLPANKRLAITGNTLALRLRQLMRVSPRTRVHRECRRETRIISGVCYGSYKRGSDLNTLLTLSVLDGCDSCRTFLLANR